MSETSQLSIDRVAAKGIPEATAFPDATQTLSAIRAGQSSAREATEACLARIAGRDGIIGAWAWVDADLARQQATARDAAQDNVPLNGLPIGIKDVLLTRDMPTQYNCELYEGHFPRIDAAAVAMLRQAGAVIVGKTETVELAAIGRPARTVNPHAHGHTPGGSSSGSAAAVADGHVPVALGTQTGGSIIRPASFCGVWAMKPTWGMISTEGCKPFAPSLDTVGWFARSSADLALMLNVFDPQPALRDLAPPVRAVADLRVGIFRTPGWSSAQAATRGAMAEMIARLTSAGAIVIELPVPDTFELLADQHRLIMMAEGGRSFLREYRLAPDRISPQIAEMVRSRDTISADQLHDAYAAASQARVEFDRLAGQFDAVIAPSTIAEAPLGLAATGDLLFNGLLTLLHVPCLNLPLFRAANGLPVGLTLTGPRHSDHRIMAVAQSIAMATKAHIDHPGLD